MLHSHLINNTQLNGGTAIYIYINFHGPCANKNHNYQPQYEKKIEYFFIHVYTHQAQQQNTFHGKP
jgi:hypothetical protein